MFKSLTLENFRGFSEPVTLEVRPITVLIGRNSAGKSSLLKFLQMLRQTLEASDERFLVPEGRHVHLGVWPELKNARSRKRQFKFSIRMAGETMLLRKMVRVRQEHGKLSMFVEGEIDGDEIVSAATEKLDIAIDGQIAYSASPRGRHSVTIKSGEEIALSRTITSLEGSSFLNFKDVGEDAVKLVEALIQDQQLLNDLRQEFRNVRHMSPVREESQRMIQMASPPARDVGHLGEFAMPHLARLFEDGGAESKARLAFVFRHLSQVAEVEQPEISQEMRGFLTRFRARNKSTGASAWLADFGFGVSQCLPIFIQGAIMEAGDLLTVEQPEAQLHPTAQIELGSFFAELWTERGIPSIVETHSGNLLLRLRRLVKAGRLSADDVNIGYCHIEDGVARVRNLSIDSNGALEDGLPMEFFGADIIESLEMEAGVDA